MQSTSLAYFSNAAPFCGGFFAPIYSLITEVTVMQVPPPHIFRLVNLQQQIPKPFRAHITWLVLGGEDKLVALVPADNIPLSAALSTLILLDAISQRTDR